MVEPETTEIAIIGAGPVGLFAVFEAGMLGLSCHVIDVLDEAGGQCAALYPEKPIYDIPAIPEIDALGLIEELRRQIEPFHPVVHQGHRVERVIALPDGGWRLENDRGLVLEARVVIVSAGGGAFGPNRPPLPGIADYEGSGVFYFVTRREDFRDKRVVIGGGGDSAVDWTISLAEVAASVQIVHRRPKFRAAPDSVARLTALADAGDVELVVPYQLAGVEGHNGVLETVVVATLDGDERYLPADCLLPFYGLSMELGPIADWGLELDGGLITVDPATCQTSRPGIFAIGDIAAYPGKLKLILCGFSEAAMAAHAIYPLIHPDQALHFEYSTMKGKPGG